MSNEKTLVDQIQEDIKIDQTDLEYTASQNPILQFKYLNLLKKSKIELLKLENTVKERKRDRYLYYSGKHPDECSPTLFEKTEIKLMLETDPDILDVETKLRALKTNIELLEGVVSIFNGRGFTIKNMIDMRKLEAGLN